MIKKPLGKGPLNVSTLCLGTMTYGEQNTQGEAHSQLDMAIEYGVNFIDTAEMYPVPPDARTYSSTETIIGNWKGLKQKRDQLILATKIAGPSTWMTYVRDGNPRLNKAHIGQAIEQSLKRLQTDYIDLYQLHWPDRITNYFGQRGFVFDPKIHGEETSTPIEETLAALEPFLRQKKIRYLGLSNETPWGVMTFMAKAKELGMDEIVSIQNPYSLLNRTYEIGLAEISYREKIGLLAYSPLAFGQLTGKYEQGKKPSGARLSKWTRFSRYTGALGVAATTKYVELAQRFGLSPAQMALAFVQSRPFVTSTIIGATNLEQLRENLESSRLVLSQEVIDGIDKIQQQMPDPCP